MIKQQTAQLITADAVVNSARALMSYFLNLWLGSNVLQIDIDFNRARKTVAHRACY